MIDPFSPEPPTDDVDAASPPVVEEAPLASAPASVESPDCVSTAALLTATLDVGLYSGYLGAPLTVDERATLAAAMMPVLAKHGVAIDDAPEIMLALTIGGLAIPRWQMKKARAAEPQEVDRDHADTRQEGLRQERAPAKNSLAGLPAGAGSAADLFS